MSLSSVKTMEMMMNFLAQNKHFMAVNICQALQAHIRYFFNRNHPKPKHCRLGNQGTLTTQFKE